MGQVYIIASGVSSRGQSSLVDEVLMKSTNDLRQEVSSMFRRLNCFAIGMDDIHVLVDSGPIYEITRTDLDSFILVSVLFLKSEEDHNLDIISIVNYRELAVAIKKWLGTMRFGSFWINLGMQVLFRFEQTDHASELEPGHRFENPVTWYSIT